MVAERNVRYQAIGHVLINQSMKNALRCHLRLPLAVIACLTCINHYYVVDNLPN